MSASVDRKSVEIGNTIQLNVSILGTQTVAKPELPSIQGLQARYLGPSTRVSFLNGQMSASIKHAYSLVAIKIGTYIISPISVEFEGKTYQTQPIKIEVVRGTASPNHRRKEEILELADYMFLTLTAERQKIYLNEDLPITITLYSRQAEVREIEYPTFNSTSFSVGNYEKPIQKQERIDGVWFNIVRFQTIVHPVSVGRPTLGPAELKCNLVLREPNQRSRSLFNDDIFSDFFGRVQTRTVVLKSDLLPITVLDFPLQGKPRDFSGSVGNFDLHVEARPTSVKVGEPITLTMAITGRGNSATITAPTLTSSTTFKIYNPEVMTVPGGKSFEQALIPKDASIRAIPEIRFSYFDPEKENYQTLRKAPIPIMVTTTPEEEELKIFDLPQVATITKTPENFGRDILYIKDSIGSVQMGKFYLYKNGLFLFAHVFPLAACLGILAYQKQKNKLTSDIGYARLKRAPRRAKKLIGEATALMHEEQSREFCDAVYKTMQEYLGDLFNLPAAGLTSEVLYEFERRGVEATTLVKLREFFELCDSVRFAPEEANVEAMRSLLELTEDTMAQLSEWSP